MKNNKRNTHVLREGAMNVLSDEEVARIGTSETAERLLSGDEYLDLEQFAQDVHRTQGS